MVEQLLSCERTRMHHQCFPYIYMGLAGRQAKYKAKYIIIWKSIVFGASPCSPAPKHEPISVVAWETVIVAIFKE